MNSKELWQDSLSQAITDPKQLFEILQLDQDQLESAYLAAKDFKLLVTQSFLKRIKPGDPNDPLLKQILPLGNELLAADGYSLDPLEEAKFSPCPGLLHKYHGRVLLITNSHCAINCRFCFRRNYPYEGNFLSRENRRLVLDYIEKDKSIEEVILSGGDPLLLNNKSLSQLIDDLAEIDHLQRLRIHTRIPIVLPERINEQFLEILKQSKLQIVMVIHCNHPQEIDESCANTLNLIKNNCHSLHNQSVLLKGVNDSVEVLVRLQKRLFALGIQSYYLHALDKVKGTSHFDIPLPDAKRLYRELSEQCSGYMLPKLVFESAGASSKIPISPEI